MRIYEYLRIRPTHCHSESERRISGSLGFTLLELVITVAIISILVAAASPIFRGFLKKTEMDAFSQSLIFDLKSARAGSMTGDGGLKWGLHLVSVTTTRSYYQVFSTPTVYGDASTSIKATNYLPLLIKFTNPAPSSSVDIIFDRIRGTLSNSMNIQLKNTVDNMSRTIVVNPVGNVSDLTSAGPCGRVLSLDYSGQTYNLVEIGTQCWFAQNLNVGTMIASSSVPSDNANIEKWCYGDNAVNSGSGGCGTGSSLGNGGLYTWAEALQLDPVCNGSFCSYLLSANWRGICPSGWHIPTDNELKTMEAYLGMCAGSGTGCVDWEGWRGTDQGTKLYAGGSSGFGALASGYRATNGTYGSISDDFYLWTSSEETYQYAWWRQVSNFNPQIGRVNFDKPAGYSVRCLKN